MKKSHIVGIALLGVYVAALERCGGYRECIDQTNVVVDDRLCRNQTGGYRWFYTYSGGNTYIGSHVNPSSGTVRGVFGSAGDDAGSHGGGGAGE